MFANKSAIGLQIEDIYIEAEEFDGEENRVGVDTIVLTHEKSQWLLSLITKDHFLNSGIKATFEERENPGLYIAAIEDGIERTTPYVLNDKSITEQILAEKFKGREVREDLADSMVFLPT